MKILFCNIAWMKHYRGITEDDEVLSDSKFVKENGYGAEETNFLPIHHQDDEWIEYNDDVTVDIPMWNPKAPSMVKSEIFIWSA